MAKFFTSAFLKVKSNPGLAAINCGIPQGSVLGPLLFLLYINDLKKAITFCKVHHFADNTNLLCMSKLNKLISGWLKESS